jgi:hypothetical protein
MSTPTLYGLAAIRQDARGRFCLNDLHKASGGAQRHQPRYWLATKRTQALIEYLTATVVPLKGDSGIPLSVIKGGHDQGTYVVRELVYSYAMWVSAAFEVKVIRAFEADQLRKKSLQAQAYALELADHLSKQKGTAGSKLMHTRKLEKHQIEDDQARIDTALQLELFMEVTA